jgi:hypothetical protein
MIIKLNNNFYRKQAIMQAAKDFADLAQIRVLNEQFEIEFIDLKKENKNLGDEFCNYVLALMKNKGMV